MNRLTIIALALALGGCAAEIDAPTTQKHALQDPVRIDRVGRPEITNFTIRDQREKPAFNSDDVFNPAPAAYGRYREFLAAGILFWDGLDLEFDWGDPTLVELPRFSPALNADGQRLLGLLASDYLLVDTTKDCGVDARSYLEVEADAVGLPTTGSCGGRTPNDDVIDTYVSLLVAGLDQPWRPYVEGQQWRQHGDGVNGPSRPATDEWPYLAAPHLGQ